MSGSFCLGNEATVHDYDYGFNLCMLTFKMILKVVN